MSRLSRSAITLSARSGASRTSAFSPLPYGQPPASRRVAQFARNNLYSTETSTSRKSLASVALLQSHPPALPLLLNTRQFHSALRVQQQASKPEDVRDPPRQNPTTDSSEQKSGSTADEGATGGKSENKNGQQTGDQQEGEQKQKKEDAPPPPPPHGDKSPWQVFTDTLRTEFKASKEWNESTKALASGVNDFTQNENIKKARSAYSAATDAATNTGGKVLKSTGKVIGQSAAWTWDTLPVKGIRASVNATGRGLEKITRPVRETEAYKSVQNVIDDGSSSRYGGWTEKEERKRKREAREMEEIASGRRPARRAEPMEEDPEYVSDD